jgi:hypothetical protein
VSFKGELGEIMGFAGPVGRGVLRCLMGEIAARTFGSLTMTRRVLTVVLLHETGGRLRMGLVAIGQNSTSD